MCVCHSHTRQARPHAARAAGNVKPRGCAGTLRLHAGRPQVDAGELEPDPLNLIHRGLLLLLLLLRRRRRRGTLVAPALGQRDGAQARVPLREEAAVREAARDVVLRHRHHLARLALKGGASEVRLREGRLREGGVAHEEAAQLGPYVGARGEVSEQREQIWQCLVATVACSAREPSKTRRA